MNSSKLVQSASRVLAVYGGRLNYTKLIKILYIADKRSIETRGRPITGDTYVAMKQGPVLSMLLNLIKRDPVSGREEWDRVIEKRGYDVRLRAGVTPDDGELSENELAIIDRVSLEYRDWTWQEMVDKVLHNPVLTPEWSKPEGLRASMPLATVYKAVKLTSEDAEQFLALEKQHRWIESCLSRGAI